MTSKRVNIVSILREDYKTYRMSVESVYTFVRMAGNKVVTLHQKSIRFNKQ